MTISRTVMWLCLPPVATVALIVAAYQRGYGAEAGSRAGAEPVMVGIFVALPFVVLMCIEVLVALAASECESWGSLTAWLVVASTAAVVIAALSLWQFRYGLDVLSGLYWSTAIVLPLVPAWLWHLRDRASSPSKRDTVPPADDV